MGISPFGAARLSRRLTLEQAAERANMDVDAVKSLEDNCVYRFGSNADALARGARLRSLSSHQRA